jgi:3-oxoacyl-(acyl-carrier-protein) synthase
MQNRVFIKAYEVVSAAGYGIDEIFENLLDKRCLLSENFGVTIGEKELVVGKIDDFAQAEKFCAAIAKIDTPIFKSDSSADALIKAYSALQNGEADEALVVASYKLDTEIIFGLYARGKYSQAVAKPFDFETDGLNAAEVSVSILLSTKSGNLELLGYGTGTDIPQSITSALQNSHTDVDEVDYIQATATGVVADDKAEAAALSSIFGQKPLVSSSKALTGHTFEASTLLNLSIAAKSIEEGIIPASAFLEHSFTNEISFAYANKIKSVKKTVINSNESGNKYISIVIAPI